MSGWGTMKTDVTRSNYRSALPDVLQYGVATYIDNEECNKMSAGGVDERSMVW